MSTKAIAVGCEIERVSKRTNTTSASLYKVEARLASGETKCDVEFYRCKPTLLCPTIDWCEFDLFDHSDWDDGCCPRCPRIVEQELVSYSSYSGIELSKSPKGPDEARDLILEAFRRDLGHRPPYSFLFAVPWGRISSAAGAVNSSTDTRRESCWAACADGKGGYYHLVAHVSLRTSKYRLTIARYEDESPHLAEELCDLGGESEADRLSGQIRGHKTKKFKHYESFWEGTLLSTPVASQQLQGFIYEAYVRETGKAPPCEFMFAQKWDSDESIL